MTLKTEPRSAWLKLRVTQMEKESIAAKAVAQGQTVTDFIRQRALASACGKARWKNSAYISLRGGQTPNTAQMEVHSGCAFLAS